MNNRLDLEEVGIYQLFCRLDLATSLLKVDFQAAALIH